MNELPTTAMGVIKLIPSTKREIQVFSDQLIASVQNGEVNPLELKAFFKALELVIKNVNEATQENQLREAEKWSEKRFTAFGCIIEKKDVGVSYDYSVCGDPVYNQRLSILEEAKKQISEREAILKALKEPITVVDDESGEVATVRPPLKKGNPGLTFSIQ